MNFICVIVFTNSAIIIVRFHFHVTFETFNFSEWQVIVVVKGTLFHSSAISFTNFSHKEFILQEHAPLMLWKSFVTPCVDITSVSLIRRSIKTSYWKDVEMRSTSRACVLFYPYVMPESRSDLFCDSKIRNSKFVF